MTITPFRLHKGDLIQIDGRLHEISRADAAGLNLMPLSGGITPIHLSHEEMFRRYFDGSGSLSIARGAIAELPAGVADALDTPIDWFPVKDQDEALKRLDYMSMCDRLFLSRRLPRTPDGYARVGRLVAWLRRRQLARTCGKKPLAMPLEVIGGTTIRQWHWRWADSGRMLNALLPLHHRKGQRESSLDPKVAEIVGHRVRKYYLTLERPPLTVIHEAIEGDIEEHNAATSDRLVVPSESTLRRWVKAHVNDYDLVFYRKGPKAAEQEFRHLKKAPKATRPLEMVQVDHTLLDLQTVVSTDGKKPVLRRLWLSVAICVATRMIVGFHLSYDRPSWTSVMECLRMGVLPKDPVVSGLDLQTSWPVYGVPEIVVVDNGLEFHSRSMKAAAGHLGFELRYTPARKPHLKGVVERSLGEVARNFLAFLPGRTFNNVAARSDYPSEDRARLSIREVREAFVIWVVDYYHNRGHSGLLNVSPAARWEELSGYGVRLPPRASDLDALIALVVDRQIRADGIEYLGLHYTAPELRTMRRRPGYAGKLWMVKVDPLDLSQALILDEARKRWVAIPSDDPELTQGLTLGEWRRTLEEAKDRAERGKRISRDALLTARRRLLSIGTAAGAGQKPRMSREDLDWADQFSKRSTPTVGASPGDIEVDSEQRRRNAAVAPAHTVARVSEAEGMVMPEPPPKQRAVENIDAPPLLFEEPEAVIDHNDPENWT